VAQIAYRKFSSMIKSTNPPYCSGVLIVLIVTKEFNFAIVTDGYGEVEE